MCDDAIATTTTEHKLKMDRLLLFRDPIEDDDENNRDGVSLLRLLPTNIQLEIRMLVYHDIPRPMREQVFLDHAGDIDMLIALHTVGLINPEYPECECLVREAIILERLDCVQYLCEMGYLVMFYDMNVATVTGNYDIIMYLRDTVGLIWDSTTTYTLIEYGHKECLIKVIAAGCPWHMLTTWAAAYFGSDDELVRFVRELGCPWSSDTILGAIDGGNYKALVYCHENDCPWDAETALYLAACCGNDVFLQYVKLMMIQQAQIK